MCTCIHVCLTALYVTSTEKKLFLATLGIAQWMGSTSADTTTTVAASGVYDSVAGADVKLRDAVSSALRDRVVNPLLTSLG